MSAIDIWINCPDRETARRIGEALVGERLAACANILGEIESVYHWKGGVESAREVPLVVKTQESLFDEVCEAVRKAHPYETPGIMGIPVVRMNDDYAEWLRRETKPTSA